MKQPMISTRIVRFGVYELDLRTSELRKQGRKIKLQEQPCRILGILLEHPGEVASREELRKRLWSDDTFVDFDHSLNTAIMRLREALGDSSENPRFIETLPRHGYRFIAPVEEVAPPVKDWKNPAWLRFRWSRQQRKKCRYSRHWLYQNRKRDRARQYDLGVV